VSVCPSISILVHWNVQKMELEFFAKLEHESVKMNCVADGDPQPTTRWLKDGKRFDANSRHQKVGLICNCLTSLKGRSY